MSIVLDRPRAVATSRNVARWTVPIAIILAVAARIPFLNHSAVADEAGFLTVGSQWHQGGTALYGNYWVDRPPLLIQISQFASSFGGLITLRLIGCVAIAIVIAGCAKSASLIAGPRAARWTAVTAAALCTTPLFGTVEVDGEMIAAPFVVIGITAAIAAIKSDHKRHAQVLATGAGAAALCALLIKQNFADVFVFLLVAIIVAWHRNEVSARRGLQLIGDFSIGVFIAAFVIGIDTWLHGTPFRGVFDAMYPFRLQAGRVLSASDSPPSTDRLVALLAASVTSGLVALLILTVWGVITRRIYGAAAWGLVAVIAFDAASIAFGGSYWTHYLIQIIAPVAIISGVLIARHQWLIRPLVVLVVLSAVMSWHTALPTAGRPSRATTVGTAIASSANRSDTLVTVYGHPNLNFAAKLASPYPYLWSLPVKTLDPQLHDLGRVLSGPNSPTWFVTWRHVHSWGVDSTDLAATLRSDYHRFGHICGRTIYLHNGITRPPLPTTTYCSEHPLVPPITKG